MSKRAILTGVKYELAQRVNTKVVEMLKVKNKVTHVINTWKDTAVRKVRIRSFVLKVVLFFNFFY